MGSAVISIGRAHSWARSAPPATRLRPACEDSLREWFVSPRVNRSGVGDDDPTMIELKAMA